MTIKTLSEIRNRLQQRQLVQYRRMHLECFRREVLDLHRSARAAGDELLPAFRELVADVIDKSVEDNCLPARDASRPPKPVLDDPQKARAVEEYERLVQAGMSKSQAALDVAVGLEGTTGKARSTGAIKDWVAKAGKERREKRRLLQSLASSVQPRKLATDLGMNPRALPASGAAWDALVSADPARGQIDPWDFLVVVEHGRVEVEQCMPPGAVALPEATNAADKEVL